MTYVNSFLVPVLTLLTMVTVKCQIMEFPSENSKYPSNPAVPNQPKFPNSADCMGFPGSPQWNKCWAKFHGDMANFQHAMEVYAEKTKKDAAKNPNGTSNYYSNSYSSYSSPNTGSSFTSKSSLSINGYYIQASGISVSSQSSNGVIKISLNCGHDMDFFESKSEGQNLELKIISSGGQKKSASIRIPPKVKMDQIKVERKGDVILVTGPSGTDSSYSSTSFSSSDYPGKFQMPPMPPMPQMPQMPQFPNFRQNFPFGNNMWMF